MKWKISVVDITFFLISANLVAKLIELIIKSLL